MEGINVLSTKGETSSLKEKLCCCDTGRSAEGHGTCVLCPSGKVKDHCVPVSIHGHRHCRLHHEMCHSGAQYVHRGSYEHDKGRARG